MDALATNQNYSNQEQIVLLNLERIRLTEKADALDQRSQTLDQVVDKVTILAKTAQETQKALLDRIAALENENSTLKANLAANKETCQIKEESQQGLIKTLQVQNELQNQQLANNQLFIASEQEKKNKAEAELKLKRKELEQKTLQEKQRKEAELKQKKMLEEKKQQEAQKAKQVQVNTPVQKSKNSRMSLSYGYKPTITGKMSLTYKYKPTITGKMSLTYK
ncbi:hypothetical protein BN1013_01970 [Candidatus Rubidus massiliensis]|nr:MAG: hypothetical protein BGO10_06645 [Chlamydia sp. 32-24]CDZ81434.1 hypothetical protein BN1013_01970 [Candidatus Rubidus massiliensis]